MLTQLDGQAAVLRTWLHQAGDILAIEWQHVIPADQGIALVRSVISDASEFIAPKLAHAGARREFFGIPIIGIAARRSTS